MNWIAKVALKFLSYDALVEMIAKALSYILEYARKNASPEAWEKAKEANKKVRAWTTLFDEVYEDDNLTPDEEKIIQAAIANCTSVESIYTLITGKDKKGKKVQKRGAKNGKKVSKRKA